MPDVPAAALQVLQTFLDASMKRDEPAMRACLNQQTLASGQFAGGGPEGVRFEVGAGAMEGDKAVIPVNAFPLEAPAEGAPAVMQLPCIMVLEDNAWKFDLSGSMERMLGGSLEQAMSEVTAAMGTALEGMTEVLGETMKQAFGESGPDAAGATNWLQAPTDYTDVELLPLAEMTPLPKTAAAISAAVGSPVLVDAAITDLLAQLGSTDRDGLVTWFDDSLFAAWGDLFSRMAQHQPPVPVAGRLRALRIEPCKWIDDRFLAIEGSDLVYRMFLNSTDGYYSDADVLDLLPGLLAGLPESPDPRTAGKRLLSTDVEEANFDAFKSHEVPRFMRRISELLGKNVTLDANWDDLFDPRDARQLYRWTLNRIYGGLALACLDPARREQLAAELHTIHIVLVSMGSERAAEFADGTLTVSIYYYLGEKGAFYERDIDKVLAGQAIRAEEPPADEAPSETAAMTDSQAEESAEQAAPDETEDEEEDDTPAPTAESINDEHFKTAVASLRDTIPSWEMQLEMVLHHPVALHLDFDSLDGRFENIQPFIHQALTATLEAITPLTFESAFKPTGDSIKRLVITALSDDAAADAVLNNGELTVGVPIKLGDHRAPTKQVTAALRKLV